MGSWVADPDDQLGIGAVVADGGPGPVAVFTTLTGVEFHVRLPPGTPAFANRIMARVAWAGNRAVVDVTNAVLAGDLGSLRALRGGRLDLPAAWATRAALAESGWCGNGSAEVVAEVAAYFGKPLHEVSREDLSQAAALSAGPVPAPSPR